MNLDGRLAAPPDPGADEQALIDRARAVVDGYSGHFEERRFHVGIDEIRALLSAADRYINDREPWQLARQGGRETELGQVLYTALEVVRIATVLLSPIMPETSKRILDFLGETRPLDGSVPFSQLTAWGGLSTTHQLGEVLKAFPRIDEKRLEEVIELAAEQADQASEEKMATEKRDDFVPIGEEITIDDFAKVDFRVGLVREASFVEGAKKLIQLQVDVGEGRLRSIFAGIRSAYDDPAVLVGKKVIVVANLKPRKMRFGLSEGMVLAGHDPEETRMGVAIFETELLPGDKVT
jgi:methionyl-tRNA synthetase